MYSSISAISNAVVKKTIPFCCSYDATTRTTTPSLLLSQSALVSLTSPASASHTALFLARQISTEIPISSPPETHPSRSCCIPSGVVDDAPPYSPEPKQGIEFPKPPMPPPLGPDIPLPKPDVVPPGTPPSPPDVIPPPPPEKVPQRPPGPENIPPPTTPPEIEPPRPPGPEILPPEIPTPDVWPPPHGPTWVT
ncbi:hypothetical protein FNV43_RR01575 [Rhamnella rubrinervis]|uniref:Uncharacterized protein n=1 Tax=Rhamnella rubrinervis TaxID=2594499 RepID=A0A8K0MS57_9ROSA|nr:hypothetical protein FNV43_RR01575 [Rhamnella rubrinervis]